MIAEPCTQNGSAEREKRLIRATKQHLLHECMNMNDKNMMNHNLFTSIFNNNNNNNIILQQLLNIIQYNLQITINDIHLRYEDNESKAAAGLCIQSISLQTTDK